MKVISFNNLKIQVISVWPREYVCETDDHSQLRIRRTDLDRNPRVPVPPSLFDYEKQSLRLNASVAIVKLIFESGYVRYALDEKVYGKCRSEEAESDPMVAELLRDMEQGEAQCLEFKSSVLYSPNPEDGRDRAFQMRELVKQLVAGANSGEHRLRIYVGVAFDKQSGQYRVSGIDDEILFLGGDRDHFLATFTNMTKQLTSEGFLMSLKMTWITFQERCVLRIDVEHNGDLVLYGNRELYVRFGSSVHRIVETSSFLSVIRGYVPLQSVSGTKFISS